MDPCFQFHFNFKKWSDRSIYGSWPFLSRQQVIFNLLTAERGQLILVKHVPHYVIMSELLCEIVLAVRDNISKHLEKIKSNLGAMSLFKYSSPSKSYVPFNFLLYQKSHLWSISKNALRQLFQENDLLCFIFANHGHYCCSLLTMTT